MHGVVVRVCCADDECARERRELRETDTHLMVRDLWKGFSKWRALARFLMGRLSQGAQPSYPTSSSALKIGKGSIHCAFRRLCSTRMVFGLCLHATLLAPQTRHAKKSLCLHSIAFLLVHANSRPPLMAGFVDARCARVPANVLCAELRNLQDSRWWNCWW